MDEPDLADVRDRVSALLDALSWEHKQGEAITGISLVVHTVVADDDVRGCDVLHLGPVELAHDAMHAIVATTQQMIEDDHNKMGLYN